MAILAAAAAAATADSNNDSQRRLLIIICLVALRSVLCGLFWPGLASLLNCQQLVSRMINPLVVVVVVAHVYLVISVGVAGLPARLSEYGQPWLAPGNFSRAEIGPCDDIIISLHLGQLT